MSNTEVLIVGAGPTGLMLACQLSLYNIPFRIIDKTEDHTTQSRALVIQARSLEIFDQMGISEKALSHGKVANAIGAFFNGKKIIRVTVQDMGGGLTRFPFLLMLEQSHTERILSEFLEAHGHRVERRTELKSFSQQENGVTAIIKLPNGQEETAKTKYVIGADGAHSVVREHLKIPFGGKTYQETLFVLDCKADVDIPNDEMYLTFSDVAIGGFFPLTNGRWRILGNLPKELERKQEITFQDIEKDFAHRTRMKVKLYDPHWISAYHAHHRYASSFRKGNGFLMGDAAHIHSPVGAQGMNTGLQDAFNLAWKLALVLKGIAKDELLDTYTEERIIIAKELVRTTDKIFSVVTSPKTIIKIIRLYFIPVVLKIAGPAFQKLKFLQRFAFARVSEIGIDYRHSSLSKNGTEGIFPPHSPKPGDRLPFVKWDRNGSEMNIQDVMKGKMFCLLVFYDTTPQEIIASLEPYKEFIAIELIRSNIQTQKLYKAFGIQHSGCYLIRPDSYIAYRSQGFNRTAFEKYLKTNLKLQ